jgi:hypothetical protein
MIGKWALISARLILLGNPVAVRVHKHLKLPSSSVFAQHDNYLFLFGERNDARRLQGVVVKFGE